MAAVNVQNRVSMAQGLLPAEVTQIGVTTQKRQNSMLLVFSVFAEDDRYDSEFWKCEKCLIRVKACTWCR